MQRRLVIAGTGSGVGKTTLTIGLMAAFKQKGYTVQGFKCGPDYLDPGFHTAVTGRVSRNLDSWMFGQEAVREIFHRGSAGADLSLIEGVMGLFDGKDPRSNVGTTAEISRILDAPVLLVVDCHGAARSAAAVVKGFQLFAPEVHIAAVIANNVGNEGHFRLVQTAVEQECGIPAVGYLPRDEQFVMPERHLGLVPAVERGELSPLFAQLGDAVAAGVDLDRLLALAERPALAVLPVLFAEKTRRFPVKMAVAKDAAFHFYYPENLELLEASGAECLYFSPLAGEEVPAEADGLYIGGGFPEEFAERLSGEERVKASFRKRIDEAMPTLAECGGFMFLTDAIEDAAGRRHPMAGVIPGTVKMQKKLAALGYRELEGREGNFLLAPGERARGHEYHYSTYAPNPDRTLPPAYEATGMRGTTLDGVVLKQLAAGYPHLHFASNPGLITRWLERCERYRRWKEETR